MNIQAHPEYDASRCFAFVHDLTKNQTPFPMPDESLDVIVLIFVLSSILPEKYEILMLHCICLTEKCALGRGRDDDLFQNKTFVVSLGKHWLFFFLFPRMQCVINRLSQLLKPGGIILLRDYGRFDLAQLRFKKGRVRAKPWYLKNVITLLLIKRKY